MATPVTAGSWRCAGWCANAFVPASPGCASTTSRSKASARPRVPGSRSCRSSRQSPATAPPSMKNELDPDFVVMAQCYARDAAGGGLVDCLRRLRAYESEAGVDWVQFESPHSEDEIRRARAVVTGPFSFMKGRLPRYLGLDEHLALGVTIAWYPGFTHQVVWAALWDFMQEFQTHGIAAWEEFERARQDRPYPRPEPGAAEEGLEKQRQLEERYFSADALAK